MSSTSQFYDKIAPIYSWIDLFLKKGTRTLETFITDKPVLSILDLGMALPQTFLKQSKHEIWGIDTSPKMLERKQHYYNHAMIMDAQRLYLLDRSFDYVIAAHILSVVPDCNQVLKEAHRVLKTGGRLLVLNHFSQDNYLGKMEKIMDPLAAIFKFKLHFTVDRLDFDGFHIVERRAMGWLKNYEMIALEKW